MKQESRNIVLVSVFIAFFFFAGVANVTAQQYEALQGVFSVKAIFDVRIDNPKSAALHLDLIRQTFKDKNITQLTSEPLFVVVFIGPSVKLISKNREGFSAEDNQSLDKIASTISQMSKDGIKLEACMVAASVFGVDPASILPEIKHVPNGFISLLAYEAKGFGLVPVY